MPIYDFRCRSCGRVFEALVRSWDERRACPSCGSEDVEKMITSSYLLKMESGGGGLTCCGRETRCETPPCSVEGTCWRR